MPLIFPINVCHVMIGRYYQTQIGETKFHWDTLLLSFIMLKNVLFVANNLNIISLSFSHVAFRQVQQLHSKFHNLTNKWKQNESENG